MTLQNKTIQRYRLFYPQETLREVSARTGIQITRVFRLFNGKHMKVEELEAFHKAINCKMIEFPNYTRLNQLIEEASFLMNNEELGKVAEYIERKNTNKRYLKSNSHPLFEDASIA